MIGYYVHHHGRGHLSRATSICAHLREPVTILSSLATPEQPGVSSVRLPRDDDGIATVGADANGALHWAPHHDGGLRERMSMITEWVSTHRPRVMVVDVSVEVTLLVRLLGVPVVVMAMPGDRTDDPHELVYRAADHIVAPWPQKLYEPPWLAQHSQKTTYVGGISRFDGRRRPKSSQRDRPSILVLNGSGGADLTTETVDRCAAAHPEFSWTTLGVKGGPWAEDPWPALCAADVVVSSAGQSSVADIAAAGRPAIIVAQDRPFAEQRATARALHRAGLAVVRPQWPDLADWPHLVDDARALGSDVWDRWQTSHSAARAAALIDRVAAA
ncbi:UDP-N-acetylglucosamine--N-acetylmuramyl-(pentapeptide) pyrophosphoryl-undecaprenol N-acetylglucosamine transferase [Mycobacterium hodleri]|uniref:UDP-N-acetylglucosamine--N-acetylmuramyl-(Pentapeptide) pyrophosphoryl-undecaprenol N-acetylglucosamine transferase n=1 Tax=Mycolicibacterium hodleri TaxID=49897 RepID=A0A544VU76_9MYCO|nr:glycosyltransferase [Mycolicibacterium hodleri]TQR83518.1 UDP-N-acetylglucosamine--N-acetylmuramyl-(pentapeptide) pyrophosphoryl-undecaprenol N-acetylglucosamine transferase [Mycolicibacterium hodleri]